MSNEEPLSISIDKATDQAINKDDQHDENAGDEGQLTTDADADADADASPTTDTTDTTDTTTNHAVQVPKPITISTLNDQNQMTELKNRLGGVFAWKKEDDQRLSTIMTNFKVTNKYIWDDVAAQFQFSDNHDNDSNDGNHDDTSTRNCKYSPQECFQRWTWYLSPPRKNLSKKRFTVDEDAIIFYSVTRTSSSSLPSHIINTNMKMKMKMNTISNNNSNNNNNNSNSNSNNNNNNSNNENNTMNLFYVDHMNVRSLSPSNNISATGHY